MGGHGYEPGDRVKTLAHGVGVVVGVNHAPACSRTWREPSYAIRIEGLGYSVAYYASELEPVKAAPRRPSVADAAHDGGTPPQVDAKMREWVQTLAERAGLASMPEPLLLQLCEAAPYALAMAQRLPALEWEAEPANVFRFPDGLPTGPRQR